MTKTVTFLLCLVAISHDMRAQAPIQFTAQHTIQFAAGTDQVRKLLSANPSLRDIVAGNFSIAREDLNDDGSKEMILIAQDSMWCGSGGCSFVVLELRGGKIATILSGNVAGTLVVTNEKIGQYRALATVDDKGAIFLGDRPGTPLFGKQLVYPMNVAQAALTRQPAPQTLSAPPVCASQACTENLEFAATITDFRAILENTNSKTLTVRMSFRNKLNRPLVLGYVSRSGIAADERGNRYVPSGERAVQGIGEIVGNSADSKFVLQPGESSDGRFEFTWNTSGQEIFGLTFQLDLAIREIVQMPGNQIRLGREYALHFDRLGNNPPSRTAVASRPTDDAARSPVTPPAPVPPVPLPQVDACRDRPRGVCVISGPFMAEITGMTPSFAMYNNLHMLQAKVRFRNLTNQPLILAYVAESAVIVDNYGGRYKILNTAFGDGAKGIGTVRSNQADPQFALAPGASGDAVFTLSRKRNSDKSDPMGATFSFDLAIAQLEVLPSQQIRTTRDYSVGFTGLSTSAVSGTATSASGPAPLTTGAAPPQVDACAGKPRCYPAGPFVAEITGMTPSFAMNNNLHMLQAKVRFRNLTNQRLILAYVAESAVIVDNYGGRYTILNTAFGDGAKGIGTVRSNQADPQFALGPGASGDAVFTLSRKRNTDKSDPMGATFSFDLAIAQLELLPSQQIRTVREYAVSLPNLTVSGGGARSILDNILKGLPKKDLTK